MENASKALIIAGAILVSILLISVGVMIISSTDGIQGEMETSMTEMEINSFNTKFLNYEGTNQKASQVKSLISAIATSNSANGATSNADEKFVAISFVYKTAGGSTATTPDTNTARANVKTTKTYTVQCNIDGTTGLVNLVTIREK